MVAPPPPSTHLELCKTQNQMSRNEDPLSNLGRGEGCGGDDGAAVSVHAAGLGWPNKIQGVRVCIGGYFVFV